MTNEPYELCRCGSGKKHKFCCKPNTKHMKIRRVVAIELLAALRQLDNFEFKPDVVDKLVQNVITLRKVQEELGVYRDELSKQLGIEPGDQQSPKAREFDKLFNEHLVDFVEVELIVIPKEDWDYSKNRIPLTVRERLLPIS